MRYARLNKNQANAGFAYRDPGRKRLSEHPEPPVLGRSVRRKHPHADKILDKFPPCIGRHRGERVRQFSP